MTAEKKDAAVVSYSKDEQYNYSSFTSDGTMTKLEASSGGSGTCLAEGTLITLADGTKKAVEDLRKGDLVMSFDHLTGEIVYKDVIIVVRTQSDVYHKNIFVFDDGTELATINEHGIFDLDLNKYVNIDHENYTEYLGHTFVSVNSKGDIASKKLVNVISTVESGYKYDIVTNGTLNYVAEDTLSVTHVLVDVACLLEIEVVNNGTGTPLADIENGVTLVKDERYKVTLTLPKDSASGYCEMLVGLDKYRSDFIVRHDEDTAKTLTYYVTARADTEVKFVVHRGIYSATPDVLADDTLEIG